MLDKLKDIFYDKNDIIVALALVVVAGFIITHQVDAIMSYPERLAEELQQEQQEQQDPLGGSAKPGGEEITDPGVEDQPGTVPEVQPPVVDEPVTPPEQDPEPPVVQMPSTEFKTAVDRTVEIPSGAYSQKIAQILSEAGVVPSQDAFLNKISEAGLETKLKAGTFKIPAGSTLDDVVKIVTK